MARTGDDRFLAFSALCQACGEFGIVLAAGIWYPAGMKRFSLLVLLVGALGLPVVGWSRDAEEKVPEVSLSQFGLGEVVNGVAFQKADLEGKPVVLEFWGVNCPPCVAFLPELAKIHRRNEEKGLKVVGIHAQSATPEQINKLLDKARVKYPVLDRGHSPVEFSGIPRAFVFGKDGKLVWTGNPHDEGFEKAIRTVVK